MINCNKIIILVVIWWLLFAVLQTRPSSVVQSGGGLIPTQPMATIRAFPAPRMSFQYPYTTPWEFYQSPWIMYKEPHLMSKEEYYRYSVPTYYTKLTWDYYGNPDIVR